MAAQLSMAESAMASNEERVVELQDKVTADSKGHQPAWFDRLTSMAAEWGEQQAEQTALSVEAETEMAAQFRMTESAMTDNEERMTAEDTKGRQREVSLGMLSRMPLPSTNTRKVRTLPSGLVVGLEKRNGQTVLTIY